VVSYANKGSINSTSSIEALLKRLKLISGEIYEISGILSKINYSASLGCDVRCLSAMFAKTERVRYEEALIEAKSIISDTNIIRAFGVNGLIESFSSTESKVSRVFGLGGDVFGEAYTYSNISRERGILSVITSQSEVGARKLGLFLGTKSLVLKHEIIHSIIESIINKPYITHTLQSIVVDKNLKTTRTDKSIKKSEIDSEIE
jgi:hypothetical protein